MRRVLPFTRPVRMSGAAAILALITAGTLPTPGVAQDKGGPLPAPRRRGHGRARRRLRGRGGVCA